MISLIREELISLGMREFRWDRIEGEIESWLRWWRRWRCELIRDQEVRVSKLDRGGLLSKWTCKVICAIDTPNFTGVGRVIDEMENEGVLD